MNFSKKQKWNPLSNFIPKLFDFNLYKIFILYNHLKTV